MLFFIYRHRKQLACLPVIIVVLFSIYTLRRPTLEFKAKYDHAVMTVSLASTPMPLAPMPKPVAQPKPQPVIHHQPKPIIQPKPKPVVNHKPKLVIKHKPKPVVKHKPKPVIKHKPKPVVKHKPKPVIKHKPKPVIKHKPKPVIKHKPKPVIKHKLKPVVEHKLKTKSEVKDTKSNKTPIHQHKGRITKTTKPNNVSSQQSIQSKTQVSLENQYIALIHAQLEKYKRYPRGRAASLQQPQGQVVIWLLVSRQGKILDKGIEKKASSHLLNRAAYKSLRRIDRLPPFPKGTFSNLDTYRFTATFTYTISN